MRRHALIPGLSVASLAVGLLCMRSFAGVEAPPSVAPEIIVATVAKVSEGNATNGKPPQVDLDIVQALRGDLKPGKISAIWTPEWHGIDTGDENQSAIKEWKAKAMEKPKVGDKYILCGWLSGEGEARKLILHGSGKIVYSPKELKTMESLIARDTPQK